MSDLLSRSSVQLYLDDLAVGQRFESGIYSLNEAQVRRFAEEFDPQPFHLSEETAAGSFFDGLAASGFHTAAITMRLIVSSLPIAGGVIGAGCEIKWLRPTRPGDTLKVEIEVVEIRPSKSRPHRGGAKIRVTTVNHNGVNVFPEACPC